MKIKDVEKRTGLSCKAIRFYEDKELLSVKRNESDYREYSEKEIERLLEIKLFRKCGLSIQELIQIKKGELLLEDVLYQHIDLYNKNELHINDQKELCSEVLKKKGDYSSLYETVKFLESDDYQEFLESINDLNNPSLAKQIFLTIVGLGPLLSSLMFLGLEQYNRLWIGIPLTVVMTILLTMSWQSFIKNYKFQNENVKQGLVHFVGMFVLFVLSLVIVFGFFFLINFSQTQIFMKGTTFILTQSRIITLPFIIIGFEMVFFIIGYLSKYLKHKDYKEFNFFYQWIKKHKWKILIVNIVVGLFCFMNVITVDKNTITKHSLFNLMGEHYSYDDVKKVETGFYGSGLPVIQTKGDFYYKLTMKNGKILSFVDCYTSKEYEEHTYSELVELDNRVMKYKPQKISSDNNVEHVMMDQEYIDRFISIILNK